MKKTFVLLAASFAAALSAMTVAEAEKLPCYDDGQGETLLNLTFDAGDKKSFSVPKGSEAVLAPGEGVNGTTALKITRKDPKAYRINGMSVGVLPQTTYELQFMIRGETNKAPSMAEFAAMEFRDGNRWLNGSYYRLDAGSRIPEKWTLCRVPFRVLKKGSKASLLLFMGRQMTGTVWFDDVRIVRKDMVGSVIPLEPATLTIFGKSGKVSFKAPTECGTDSLLLVDLSGKKQLLSMGKDRIFRGVCKDLKPGTYSLSATLIDVKKKLKGKPVTVPVFVKNPEKAPKNAVVIDSYGRAIVNGKPFFPMGIYAYPGKAELDAVAKAGFNCIACYSVIHGKDAKGNRGVKGIRYVMDDIWSRKLMVIFSLKDQILKHSVREMDGVKGNLAVVDHVVKNLKDHPALLSWYVTDELPLSQIGKAVELRGVVAKADPWHPRYSITYRISDMPSYAVSGDITGMDPYPISHKPGHYDIHGVAVQTELCRSSGQPYWIIPQMFSWARYRCKTKEDFLKGRFPTQDEMIAMPLLAVIHGARGLVFYSAYDMLGRSEAKAPGSSKAQWARAVETLKVLNPLQKYFLWKEKPAVLSIQANVSGQLEGAVFKAEDGKIAVILVGCDRPAKGTFTVPGYPKLRSLLGRTKNLGNGKYEFSVSGVQADVLVE